MGVYGRAGRGLRLHHRTGGLVALHAALRFANQVERGELAAGRVLVQSDEGRHDHFTGAGTQHQRDGGRGALERTRLGVLVEHGIFRQGVGVVGIRRGVRFHHGQIVSGREGLSRRPGHSSELGNLDDDGRGRGRRALDEGLDAGDATAE